MIEIIVQVIGGVAKVVKKPKGVKLTILDYDNAWYEFTGKPSEEVHEENDEVEWQVNSK